MIAIAIVAMLFSTERLRARRAAYVRLLGQHASDEYVMKQAVEVILAKHTDSDPVDPAVIKEFEERYSVLAAYHSSLRRKYQYAASHPGWTVPPDLPAPDLPIHDFISLRLSTR